MKRLLFLLALTSLFSGCAVPMGGTGHGATASAQAIPLTANRYWTGQAYQKSSRSNWLIAGFIIPGQDSLMTYPSLGCTARWTYEGVMPNGAHKYHEQVFRDPRNTCVKSLTVSVRATGPNTVEYNTYSSPGQVDSTAILRAEPLPMPVGVTGSWTGFAKDARGQETEVQLRLNRDERSYFHQFASGCTYELFMAEFTERGAALDTTTGVSDKGMTCDGSGVLMFSLKPDGTLMMRSYLGSRLTNEAYLKRM